MEKAKPILETLAQQEGINLAMIVSRDGFILEMETAREVPAEPDTIGAAVSTFWNTLDSLGKELEAGGGLTGIFEFKGAQVSASLIPEEDLLLTVVADKKANPAMVRYLTYKFSELLTHAL
jgi:predicted regulator of Ras-like GTPase activity (Roadblock/LC7/MglB family)